jgi:dihydroneopterin triphosphate diphosphatase
VRLPIQVLIYVYRNSGSGRQYLICHRQPDSGGFWQAVSGGVESGEIPIEAARRELGEETGLNTVVHDLNYAFSFPLEASWRQKYDWDVSTMIAHAFVSEAPRDAAITSSTTEHSEFLWCSFEKALEMLYWPEDKEALRRAEEFVRIHE